MDLERRDNILSKFGEIQKKAAESAERLKGFRGEPGKAFSLAANDAMSDIEAIISAADETLEDEMEAEGV